MKVFIAFALLYSITGSRASLSNVDYFDKLLRQHRMEYLGGGRNLEKSVPALSLVSSPSPLPSEDAILSDNKPESIMPSGSTPSKEFIVPALQRNNTFSLEEITQPGANATYNIPSDLPSFVPSQASSDEPSGIPSDIPSLTPSDEPSLTPTQSYSDNANRQPNKSPTTRPSAPVSIAVPTLKPSAVPSEVYSGGNPSTAPTSVNSNVPTTIDSAIPSKEGTWTSVPTLIHSSTPSAMATQVTKHPSTSPISEVNSSSRPSNPPSQSLAPGSSIGPIDNSPTGAPSAFIEAGIPSEETSIHSTVQLLELTTSTDTEMSEDDVKVFQSICKSEFLPTFLPKTHGAVYNRVDCVILSQSIGKQRKLQGGEEPREFLLSVLIQVRSEVNLPGNVAFSHIVSLTFQTFSGELQLLLGSMAYFPSVHAPEKGPIVTEIQGGADPPRSDGGMTTTMLAGALLGGAVLALIVSGLIIHRSRQSWGAGAGNTRPREVTRQNIFSSSSARSIPRVIGFATDGATMEKGLPASSPKSVTSENSSNIEDISKNVNMECQSRTNSAERTEGSGSLDCSLHGLDILQSSVSSGESKMLDAKRIAWIGNGRRRKSDEKNHKDKEAEMVTSMGSDDVSTDLECGAELTNNTHTQTGMEDCHKVAPSEDYVQRNETPEGESFLQMHLDNAAHTGEVLNDLGQFEEQWHDRLTRVRVSASAETPRQANTHYKRPPRSRSMIISTMSNDVLSEFTDAESL